MDIWFITIGELLPIKEGIRKSRTAFLAEKLIEKGHKILWWTSAFDHFKKKWIFNTDTTLNLKQNFTIKALRGLGYKKNFSLKRFLDHRLIALKFKNLVLKEQKPDIIITSMPSHDLAYEAVIFAKKNKIPVIVDVRDQWPDIFFEYFPAWIQKIAQFFLYQDFQMVKHCFKNATHLVSVMESMLNWALSRANREKAADDRVFYLGAKKIKSVSRVEKLSFIKNIVKDKFVVTFIGAFNECYNPLILTKVAKILSNLNIHFILGGDGIYFPQVKEASEKLKNVTLTGWLQEEEINFLLSLSDIGVVPSTRKIDAFPNKSFTYFSAGLPIISSVEGDLKELIKRYNLGFYYSPNDINLLLECVKKFYEDKYLYKQMAQNVNDTFDRIFDADKIYKEYAEYIERIASKHKNHY